MAKVKNIIKDGETGKMGKHSTTGAVCAINLFLCSAAGAANYSYTGAFSADDDVQLFNFTADGTSPVVLQTFGYGGGTMDDDRVIAPGGFDPMLTVFDSNGLLIGGSDNGLSPPVDVDPVTGEAFDALFKDILTAGNYTVALTQYGNFSLGTLADGFIQAGNLDFTKNLDGNDSCSRGQFCSYDPQDDPNLPDIPVDRTNQWAFDITGVVPVPAAVWLFGSGLLGLIAVARRYKA